MNMLKTAFYIVERAQPTGGEVKEMELDPTEGLAPIEVSSGLPTQRNGLLCTKLCQAGGMQTLSLTLTPTPTRPILYCIQYVCLLRIICVDLPVEYWKRSRGN